MYLLSLTGEAVGRNCRVPYLKGGFEVHGQPEGITFKKPYNYGKHQLQNMESADNIKFILQDSTQSQPQSPSPFNCPAVDKNKMMLLLSKIAGENAAKRVLQSPEVTINEDEVEVINFSLTEDEKLLLYAYNASVYFSPDAWLSVGMNLQHSDTEEDPILPIYTEAEENFWLFRVRCKPSKIAKCLFTTKIKGKWMNLEEDMLQSAVIVLLEKTSYAHHMDRYISFAALPTAKILLYQF